MRPAEGGKQKDAGGNESAARKNLFRIFVSTSYSPTNCAVQKVRGPRAVVVLYVMYGFRFMELSKQMALITYLVEDSATIRDNLISTLEEIAPVKVVGFAETEDEASAWLSNHNGDWQLAIVDLFLKEGSGLGVLKGCQNRNANQKVIVLTNYATTDIRRRCAELGSDAVFDKSNELDELLDYFALATSSKDLH